MKSFIAFLTISCLLLTVNFITPAFAQIGLNITNQGKKGIPISKEVLSDPDVLFGNVFRNTIALLFTVGALGFIIMFVWGAVDWILSGGDKEKIAGARKRIVTAITGLVLLGLAFAITSVIGHLLGIDSLRLLEFSIPKLVP